MFKRGQIVQHRTDGRELAVVARDAHRNFAGNLYLSATDFDGRHIRPMSVAYYLCRNINTGEDCLLRHEDIELAPEQPS